MSSRGFNIFEKRCATVKVHISHRLMIILKRDDNDSAILIYLLKKRSPSKKTAWIMSGWCNYNRFSTTHLAHGGKSFFIIQFCLKLCEFSLHLCNVSLFKVHSRWPPEVYKCLCVWLLVGVPSWLLYQEVDHMSSTVSSFPLVFAALHHCSFA